MSEDENNSVNLVSSSDKNTKNPALGKGKLVPDVSNLIPFETPGREVVIRPRSPFREVPSVSAPDNIRPIDQIHSVPLSVARSSPGSSKFSKDENRYQASFRGRGVRDEIPSPLSASMMQQTPRYHQNDSSEIFNSGAVTKNLNPQHYQIPPGYQLVPQNLPPPMPDYDNMTLSEQEDARIIFRSKFNKLKEKYPERNFDDYESELPLRHIHRIYEDHLNAISTESNFSMSKIFLAIIFFCIEGFFTKFIGIDISGFASDQLKQFKRYESLLMELGEKYTSGFGSNWPIELRILFLIGFNTLSLAGIKFLCSKTDYPQDQAKQFFNSLIGSQVDDFVETKEPPKVDPVTKTVDPDTDDTATNFMGRTNEIAKMASNLFGGPNSDDPMEIAGHWGNKALNSIRSRDKSKESKVEAGGKRKLNNIRYGRNRRR